jgi:tetratricopeptide (TPR) repeat protein
MIQTMPCPDANTLASLLGGRLPYSQVELLSRHLECCSDCACEADRLGIEDPLAANLKSSESIGSDPDESRINDLIQHLCHRKSTVNVAELVTTSDATIWDVQSSLVPTHRSGFLGRIGPYWVQKQIGTGGMGEVYLARQERPDRAVALKIVRARPGSDKNLLARFRAEADTAARLRHPNIVQVHEAGESDGAAFIAMELVEGGNLATRLAQAVLAPREAAKLLGQLARAVHFAHLNGVVHRDLKPSNVLLDRDGTPKLSDFGLARVLDDTGGNQTQTGVILGTPSYMAPEQVADGKTVGPAADVYGLGAILYECLTGRPPFKGASVLDTLEQIRSQEPILPGRLQPGIPRDLQTSCLKCLEKDPTRRYASASTLAEDLDCFLRGEPIKARPVSAFTRGWKWARRRPAIASLLLTTGFLATGLIGLFATYTTRLRTEVDRANAQQARVVANYQSARKALTLMIHRLDGHQASEIPHLRELRRDQLEDALAFYERILGGLDDLNPEIQLDTALAATDAGGIQFSLGREEAAKETFRRAIALFEGLPDELRSHTECRNHLIFCYNHLAYLLKDKPDKTKTKEYFLKARAEAEELTRSDPNDPNLLNVLAKSEHNLGMCFADMGQKTQGVEHYLRAIKIRGRLLTTYSKSELYRAELGEDFLNLGLIHHDLNQIDKAVDAFHRADDLLRPLVEAIPGNDLYSLSLAALLINWGNLLLGTDLSQALTKYNKAVELTEVAIGRDQLSHVARLRALQAHGARALARERNGELAGSLVDWDRVVALADDSTRPGHRVNRAILMHQVGMSFQATGEAYALKDDPRISDYNRYNLASILALSSKPITDSFCLGSLANVAAAEVHKTTAIVLLRRLHDSGYFRQPGYEKLLTGDSDFILLRARADFQALIKKEAKP